ncbi:microtubule cross-linking factor 1-like [Toxotes jaculatrix]|uniref:microtubule cross-linking factor 1-like n=1 Tax=Toxotes jaculatrix TaxID=941984 RepID=UPI001B3B09B8|nr:microtubule cross-linking factor 1-like [Toxotes jaculatrix]
MRIPSPTRKKSSNGSGSDTKPQNHQLEKKRLNRAPSPARPFLKDVHSRSTKPPAIVPKSPKLNKQQQQSASVPLAHPNRSSRRNTTGAKEKPATVKSSTKSAVAKKPTKVPQHAAAEPKAASIKPDSTSSPILAKGKKGKLASGSPGPHIHGSPIRVPTGAPLGRVSQTDSSSDLSDCPSEPLSDEQRLAPAATGSR